MVSRRMFSLVRGWVATVTFTAATSAWGQSAGEQPVEVARARLMLALWGIIIAGMALLIFIRLFTYSVRRRWRTPGKSSRMGPLQWQARRWRERWRKTQERK